MARELQHQIPSTTAQLIGEDLIQRQINIERNAGSNVGSRKAHAIFKAIGVGAMEGAAIGFDLGYQQALEDIASLSAPEGLDIKTPQHVQYTKEHRPPVRPAVIRLGF